MQRDRQIRTFQKSYHRLARSLDKLMRTRLTHRPCTPEQGQALEILVEGPITMKTLADELAIHQSTLTRIVEKLERAGLAQRVRRESNQRVVEVEITAAGRDLSKSLSRENRKIVAGVLDLVPADKREIVVEAMEALAGILRPDNRPFVALLENCCRDLDCGCPGGRR